METLAGKSVFVIGAGRSGRSAAARLLSEGARVTLVDGRPREELERPPAGALPGGVAFLRGMMGEGDVPGADLVVLSPGVPPEKLPGEALARRGTPVWGELEYGFRRFRGRIAAVTGTNGKSTVTSLLGEMARRAFPRVFVGGNLGTPLVEAGSEPHDWGVVEVSSFQLETIVSFRPAVAVLLNITEDHRDRYRDFDAYAGAKMALFAHQRPEDAAVLNADDPEVEGRASGIGSRRVWFSLARPLEAGVFLSGEDIVFREGGVEERYPRSLLRIRGLQNVANAMAAVAAARCMGIGPEAVREGLSSFPGLPHRVEFVRAVGGVSYVNDSKGTNVGAVLACLEGIPEPVVLIAGGKDKGIDFTPLRESLRRKARVAILIGEARLRMERTLAGAVPVRTAASLEEAVRDAAACARPGDVVLFSPACSSFDMFRNFEERGEAFRAAVRGLSG